MRRIPAVFAALLFFTTTTSAAHLVPEAIVSWNAYVAATEERIARELASRAGFLALDFGEHPDADRGALRGGGIVTEKMATMDASGRAFDVPSARVHHWRGAALIPGVTVAAVLARLMNEPPAKQEDVVASRVLERGPNRMRVYLKLQRSAIVSVVYNTEHTVTFARRDRTHATSASVATRIAELSKPYTANERELPAGDDRGFLWKLNSYWRYEEVPEGVIAECESLTLSRDVPSVVRYVASPLIDGVARESLERTLVSLREAFRARP